MTEAGGTTTVRHLANVGYYGLYEISNDSCDDAETITVPTTSVPEISTTSQVIVVGVLNETTENQMPACSASYSESGRQFTFHESGASSDVVDILFYVRQ